MVTIAAAPAPIASLGRIRNDLLSATRSDAHTGFSTAHVVRFDNGGGGGGGGSTASCGNVSTQAGIFGPVLDKLLPLARNAWGFGVAILIVIASLGGLFYAIKGAAGASIGGGGMTSNAIIGMVAIIVLVLMAFLLLPQLSCMLQTSAPAAPF